MMSGIGLSRVNLLDKRKIVDLVPADRTINAMTALAWYQTTQNLNKKMDEDTSASLMTRETSNPVNQSSTVFQRQFIEHEHKRRNKFKPICKETSCLRKEDPQEECRPPCLSKGDYKDVHSRKNNKVFNYVSYNDNRVILFNFLNQVIDSYEASGESNKLFLWKRHTYITMHTSVYYALFYVLHSFPAVVFSLTERLTHHKPLYMKYLRKIFFLTKTISHFCLNEWAFENTNIRTMVDAILPSDRICFDCSMANFRWEPLFAHIPRTTAIYLMKEPLTKAHYEKRTFYVVWADYWIWLTLKMIAMYLFLTFLANQINSFLDF